MLATYSTYSYVNGVELTTMEDNKILMTYSTFGSTSPFVNGSFFRLLEFDGVSTITSIAYGEASSTSYASPLGGVTSLNATDFVHVDTNSGFLNIYRIYGDTIEPVKVGGYLVGVTRGSTVSSLDGNTVFVADTGNALLRILNWSFCLSNNYTF